MSTPFRQHRDPIPLPLAITPTNVDRVAWLAVERINSLTRHRGHASYLFVDQRHAHVYVLSEAMPTAHRWAKTHQDWWHGTWKGPVSVHDIRDELVSAVDPFFNSAMVR